MEDITYLGLDDMPMDAASAVESHYENRSQERTVKFVRGNPGHVTSGSKVTVMILYADPVISAGLAAVVHQCAGFQVVPAREPGNSVCGPSPADVVVADYETAMRLAENTPRWAKNVVVFTNYASETKICRALESGARGYLLYGIGLPELFEGIRSVHGGGVALSPQVAAQVTNRIKGETLTPREIAVLEELMLGLSNKEIARRLNLSVGTIKTHVKSILQKLDTDSRTAAVAAAHRRGLLP